MNTKNRQDPKHSGQKNRPKQRPKTQTRSRNIHDDRTYHEQERPETRMFR